MRPQNVQIVTPEAVVLSLTTGGVGSRSLARALDVLVQGALSVAVLLGAFFISRALGTAAGGGGGSVAFLIVELVALTVIWIGYPIAFETLWRGRTPGKAALGLRVVTSEGAPIRFRHALVRGVLGIIDVWLVAGSIGIVTMLVSRRDQRFGDMAAGTIVVRERSGAPAPAATVFAPPPGCEDYVANLDVSGVSPAGYEAARAFLLRADGLAPGPRADLAVRLARSLLGPLHHSPPSWMGPELWLACLAAAYQRRHGGPWTGFGYGYGPGGYWPAGYGSGGYGSGGYGPGGYGPAGYGYGAPGYGAPGSGQPGSGVPGSGAPASSGAGDVAATTPVTAPTTVPQPVAVPVRVWPPEEVTPPA